MELRLSSYRKLRIRKKFVLKGVRFRGMPVRGQEYIEECELASKTKKKIGKREGTCGWGRRNGGHNVSGSDFANAGVRGDVDDARGRS